MNFPELDSPVETAEMRRSAAVELFLDGKRYTPKPGLAIETRDRQAAVLGKGSVSVSQSRTSPEDPKELNIVQLMGVDTEGATRLFFAGWYMGEEGFIVNTFPYEDDIEQILHEAKRSRGRA